MEIKGSQEGTGQGDSPHADNQAIYIEKGVASSIKDTIDDNCAEAPSYHIDG